MGWTTNKLSLHSFVCVRPWITYHPPPQCITTLHRRHLRHHYHTPSPSSSSRDYLSHTLTTINSKSISDNFTFWSVPFESASTTALSSISGLVAAPQLPKFTPWVHRASRCSRTTIIRLVLFLPLADRGECTRANAFAISCCHDLVARVRPSVHPTVHCRYTVRPSVLQSVGTHD